MGCVGVWGGGGGGGGGTALGERGRVGRKGASSGHVHEAYHALLLTGRAAHPSLWPA